MDWKSACVVVVPCLNEERAVASVVRQAGEHAPAVIVVDDGSTDSTTQQAETAGAAVLRHPTPRGKGAALETALAAAVARGFQWALIMDGDGQHDAADIPRFFACAEATGAALVVGNRMGDPGCMPLIRRLVNRWMSRRLSIMAGQPLPDTQCGYRLVQLAAWQQLQRSATHFEVESEMLVQFIRAGKRIAFVPIRVIYEEERSKIRPWTDTIRWFRWWREVNRKA